MSVIHSTLAARREAPRRRPFSFIRYIPLVPPTTVLLLLFAMPMGMMIGLSFQSREGAVTLENYGRFFGDDLVLEGLLRTVVMSVLVAASVTVLAYPLAYYLARSASRWRSVVFALVIAPELAGVVLRTYGWLVILENHGFINNALMSLGLVSEPLPLAKSMVGVVIGLTHVLLPFGVLSLLPSFQGIDPNLEKSAQILGASRLSVLRHIIVPLSLPGILSSFFIAFTLSASAYATPALIGGAGFHVMATMIYEQLLVLVDWSFAAVMANILLIIVVGVAFASSRIESRLHSKLNV
jgi:putative spermidine/putrescine transport system permease protein